MSRGNRVLGVSLAIGGFAISAACLVSASIAQTKMSGAEFDQIQNKFYKQIEALTPRPTETRSLVLFSVGGIKYRVPRSYILYMNDWQGGEQGRVRLEVTTPSFQPRNKSNEACFANHYADRPRGCSTIDFDILVPRVRALDETYKNGLKIYHGPKPGPFGYDLYEVGPTNARSQVYFKRTAEGRELVFDCFGDLSEGQHLMTCSTKVRAARGGIVGFGFPLDQLRNAESYERHLRGLVDSFTF